MKDKPEYPEAEPRKETGEEFCARMSQQEAAGKWPNTLDAMEWAKEFISTVEHYSKGDLKWIDRNLMLSWFANSIMAGYDAAKLRYEGKPWLADPDSPEMRQIIDLLEEGSAEIRMLRQRKEVLDARVDTFQCMMELLRASPPQFLHTGSPDIAYAMTKKIQELKAQ